MKRVWLVTAVLFFAVGCATSQQIVVNPAGRGRAFKAAHVIVHGDRSADVDASLQRELLLRGLSVTAGTEANPSVPAEADLLVRYQDGWRWDLVMYLKRLDLQIYDAQTDTLLASATWKNSALHGFHGMDKVVRQLVAETFSKLAGPAR